MMWAWLQAGMGQRPKKFETEGETTVFPDQPAHLIFRPFPEERKEARIKMSKMEGAMTLFAKEVDDARKGVLEEPALIP